MKNLKFRVVLIVAICVAGGLLLYWKELRLGLDLQGGAHLVLQVDTQEALEAEVNQVAERMRSDLEEDGIAFSEVRAVGSGSIELLGVPQDFQNAVESYLENYRPGWEYRISYRTGQIDAALNMTPATRNSLGQLTVRQARDIIANRIDQYGVAEPTITVYGSGEVPDQIIVELPGVDDFDRVVGLIRSTARLELKLVHPTSGGPFATREAALQAFNGQIPEEYEGLAYRERQASGGLQYLVVRKAAAITGQHLKNARRVQDQLTGQSEVSFFLNAEGVNLFSRVTGQNVGNRLAIVLDNEIRSAPVIESQIDTESARITGRFSPQEAEDLALILRSGALPADITILENRTIGPSLGRESIIRGVYASLTGLTLVVLGMLVVYRFSGINAIICLIMNLIILLGVMAQLEATLTLPGIAGVILTIGMAVDANILIFERIKEELRLGKTVRAAVQAGFGRVLSTILDTNITTLIAAAFLFQFGTGPVQGFAVTLAIGLIANLFTAIFVSRTMFNLVLSNREVDELSI